MFAGETHLSKNMTVLTNYDEKSNGSVCGFVTGAKKMPAYNSSGSGFK